MKKRTIFAAILLTAFIFQGQAFAHFGMVIPSDAMVMQGERQIITLTLSFSHPFEGIGMELIKPKAVGVLANGKKLDLLDRVKKSPVMGRTAWKVDYQINRPGVYMFYMEPEPYWEAVEDCFIIHYTKTVVTAFGDDRAVAPTDYMIAQTIKADKNGVFTYAAPKSGWWGFAALNTSQDKILHAGKEKEVELGAVIWVQFHDWQMK